MKVLIVGDIHYSDKPPSARTASYSADILQKLEYTVQISAKENVEGVIWAGDVFHSKIPSRSSHRAVQELVDIGRSYQVPWYIVPGNHDMQNDRLDSLSSQPLGVLFKAGAIELNGWGHGQIFGVPFLQDWAQLPQVLENYREFVGNKSCLVVAHAPIMPPGVSVPYDFIPAEDWAALQTKGACYYGHIHENHGIYDANGVSFCNHGALVRGSLHESDIARKPAVTIWTDSEGFRRIEVPHKPAQAVYLFPDNPPPKDEVEFEEFLERVSQTSFDLFSIESLIEHVRRSGFDEEVESLILELLDFAAS